MDHYIKLPFISELDRNLDLNNGLLQVLLGPRQVGKTTTILEFLGANKKNQFYYVSADAEIATDNEWVCEQWHRAFQEKKILVIDEIQKCFNWSEIIKKLWDQFKREKKQLRCILLGSSSLQIQKGLSESLTGRFQLIHAYHWNYFETKQITNFSFEDYLKWGGYPGSYQFLNSKDWASYLKQSIISTVIEKDILQYQNVKNPSLFKQAFEIISSYPAQEISYNKLLGQLQDRGNTDLVKYYLSLYEGAFLIKILHKYSAKILKVKSSSPKILLMCPALFQINYLDDYEVEDKGRVFELVVGAQLARLSGELLYWREGNAEVDYVYKIGKKVFAIEVKSGRRKSTKGLAVFKEKFSNCKQIIITPEHYEEFELDPEGYLQKNSW